MNPIGKINLEQFRSLILPHLGAGSERVLVSPMIGVDAGVVDLGNDRVLIVAEDPIFPAAGLSWKDFGWFTVHIGASDVAVMGVPPQFMTYSLLLSPGTTFQTVEEIVRSVHEAAEGLRIAIVGGHTGTYPAVTVPIVGGITVFSVAGKGDYVTSAGARIGDRVLLTKGPAIEATGLLAVVFEDYLASRMSAERYGKARQRVYDVTVVKDALTAKAHGRVTAMHDATEGGVVGGLFEVANASRVGMWIEESRFIFPEEVEETCGLLGIEPLEAISEGSLILTVNPEDSRKVLDALNGNNLPASDVGEVVPESEGCWLARRDGTLRELAIPPQDPFWPKYFEGLQNLEGRQ